MTAIVQTPNSVELSKAALWAGRVLAGIVVFFLLFDSAMKLLALPIVTRTMADIGWPADAETARALGLMLVIITLLYVIPRTAMIGAILLTAFLGGAVATHARIGDPLFTHTLFGVYVGVLAWTALWLRNPKFRDLLGN